MPVYDLATGLGSVDATQLVNHWNDSTTQTSTLALSSTQTAVTLAPGQISSLKISSAVGGGFNAAVTLSVTGVLRDC